MDCDLAADAPRSTLFLPPPDATLRAHTNTHTHNNDTNDKTHPPHTPPPCPTTASHNNNNNKGSTHAAIDELEEATRLYAMGLQLNPRHALLQFAAGAAHAAAGRPDEASRAFEAVLRTQPDFVAARQYLDVLRAENPLWWHSSGYLAAMLTAAAAALAAAQQVRPSPPSCFPDAPSPSRLTARGR